jgi:hypothetical protein
MCLSCKKIKCRAKCILRFVAASFWDLGFRVCRSQLLLIEALLTQWEMKRQERNETSHFHDLPGIPDQFFSFPENLPGYP